MIVDRSTASGGGDDTVPVLVSRLRRQEEGDPLGCLGRL